jgi:uroporphyrinogen-III synthase
VKVAVTRAREGAAELTARLAAEGFDVVEVALVRIEPLNGPPIRVDRYDWLVLTSRAAVELLFGRVAGPLPRVAVIGPGTAEALRAHRVEPALVAARSTQEGLAAELPRPAGRVLFAGAEGARDVLARELDADFVPLYRTVAEPVEVFPDADLVVLASASAAHALAVLRRDLACVSIGPATSAEARARGLNVVVEARTHDLNGLVEAVKLARSGSASSPS